MERHCKCWATQINRDEHQWWCCGVVQQVPLLVSTVLCACATCSNDIRSKVDISMKWPFATMTLALLAAILVGAPSARHAQTISEWKKSCRVRKKSTNQLEKLGANCVRRAITMLLLSTGSTSTTHQTRASLNHSKDLKQQFVCRSFRALSRWLGVLSNRVCIVQ